MASPGDIPALNCQTNPNTTAAPNSVCWAASSLRKARQSTDRRAVIRTSTNSSAVNSHWPVESRLSVIPISGHRLLAPRNTGGSVQHTPAPVNGITALRSCDRRPVGECLPGLIGAQVHATAQVLKKLRALEPVHHRAFHLRQVQPCAGIVQALIDGF